MLYPAAKLKVPYEKSVVSIFKIKFPIKIRLPDYNTVQVPVNANLSMRLENNIPYLTCTSAYQDPNMKSSKITCNSKGRLNP